MQTRPLDLVGIFERAVALYGRHFVPFVSLMAVAVLPVAVVQYAVAVRIQPQLDATLEVLQHPERLRTEHVPTLLDSPATLALSVAALLFGYYMLSFAVAAVGCAVARLYENRPISFSSCYAAVLRRWPAIVLVVAVALVAMIAAYFVTILVVAVPLVAASSLAANLLPALAPVAISAMIFAIGFALVVVLVAATCAIYAIVIEGGTAAFGIARTAARTLCRREFGRALLCGLAVAAIGMLALTAVDSLAFSALERLPAAYVTLDALTRTIVTPLLAIVLAVYYFDVRRRGEDAERDAGTVLLPIENEPVYAPTAYLSGEERALIKRFLERRESLSPQRRGELAAQLAAPVRPRVPADLQRLDDEALLERL